MAENQEQLSLDIDENQPVDVEFEAEEGQEGQEAQQPEQNEGQEHEEYSARVRKRLDKMTARLREAERREQAAIEYAANVQTHLKTVESRAKTLDQGFLVETEGRIGSQLAIVEANLQDAVERGDGKGVVEAQKLFSQLMAQQERLKNAKAYSSQRPESSAPLPPQELTQARPRPDPKAESWAEEREWFGSDEELTQGAYKIHEELARQGFDLTSDEYYDELDRRIVKYFPHRFQVDTTNVPNVAPATRSSSSTQRGRKSIKLTPSEVSIARRLGVPLDEYAKFVRR
jgi:hypothetical protein